MSTAIVRKDHDWVGRLIDGRFTLLQWLGGSESSDVFLTELPENPSQKAAIKLMSADAVDADAYIAGWAATTTLSHPHLIRLFHTGTLSDQLRPPALCGDGICRRESFTDYSGAAAYPC